MPPDLDDDGESRPAKPEEVQRLDGETERAANREVISEASELLRPLLRNPAEAPAAANRIVAALEVHKGPLPHPRILKGYDEIVPGAAGDIIRMARDEQRHRHKMQNRETAYPYFGMLGGILCLLLCLGGAIFIAYLKLDYRLGVALIGAPVITAVALLIKSRIANDGDLFRDGERSPFVRPRSSGKSSETDGSPR